MTEKHVSYVARSKNNSTSSDIIVKLLNNRQDLLKTYIKRFCFFKRKYISTCHSPSTLSFFFKGSGRSLLLFVPMNSYQTHSAFNVNFIQFKTYFVNDSPLWIHLHCLPHGKWFIKRFINFVPGDEVFYDSLLFDALVMMM